MNVAKGIDSEEFIDGPQKYWLIVCFCNYSTYYIIFKCLDKSVKNNLKVSEWDLTSLRYALNKIFDLYYKKSTILLTLLLKYDVIFFLFTMKDVMQDNHYNCLIWNMFLR